MATKKVKKFGRGGDIVTGIGAALIGRALYDKYVGKNDSKDDDYTRRVKEYGTKGDFPGAQKHEKAVPDTKKTEDRKEYVAADEEENKAKRTALAGGMSYKKPEASTAVDTSNRTAIDAANAAKDARAKRKTVAANAANAANAAKNKNVASITTSSVIDAGVAAGNKKPKLTPLTSKPNEERPSKPYPEKQARDNKVMKGGTSLLSAESSEQANKSVGQARREQAAELGASVKKFFKGEPDKEMTAAERRKGQGLTPYAPSKGVGSSAHSTMLRESRDPEMVKRRREESERKEKEEAKKRKSISEIRYDEMGNPYKRGGAVKKYASGGSVSSASKRADGIAMRGKTRGKVC